MTPEHDPNNNATAHDGVAPEVAVDTNETRPKLPSMRVQNDSVVLRR
jgi:hypothetical protein